jgi:pyridoxal 5'-phosphate synthase pdxS subunit
MVDESEVLTPADPFYHVDKSKFTVPFVCGARNLGEGLRRIGEGAAMIRTKGEAGTGDVIEAVRHQRMIREEIRALAAKDPQERMTVARKIDAPYEQVEEVAKLQRLPVVNFAAGGLATPPDAALMMQLGSDGVFVGSGIFKSSDPGPRAKAIVEAVTHFDDPRVIAEVSKGLGDPMKGMDVGSIPEGELLQERGW